MSVPFLQVDNISAHWGQQEALKSVSFLLSLGERMALLGPNGGGKSTLMLVLAGLHRLSGGQVLWDGKAGLTRSEVGMAFQVSSLDVRLSIRENLILHSRLQGMKAHLVAEQIKFLLKHLGLAAEIDKRVEELSGGQQRRSELAKALLHRPRLLLLDEPTAGLDPVARKDFWDLLNTLATKQLFSVITSTHLIDEAESCQWSAVLHSGRLTLLGTPQQLRGAMQQNILTLGFCSKSAVKKARPILEKFSGLPAQCDNEQLKVTPFSSKKLPELLKVLNQNDINYVQLAYPSLEEVIYFSNK